MIKYGFYLLSLPILIACSVFAYVSIEYLAEDSRFSYCLLDKDNFEIKRKLLELFDDIHVLWFRISCIRI